jgi:hypothetical protein
MWKEVAMAYAQAQPWYLPGRAEENHRKCVSIVSLWGKKYLL